MMQSYVKDVVHECTKASDESRVTFGEVVMALTSAGIERYHADLVRAEKTYYLADGASECVSNEAVVADIAPVFSAEGVEAAVRSIQAGKIDYKTFCARIMASGCVGYQVSIAGRRAVYYGRTADSHTEWFPGAN